MAEPVLRDPASPEPARRRGPQPVRAATAKVSPSGESSNNVPVPGETAPGENEQVKPTGTQPADLSSEHVVTQPDVASASSIEPKVPVVEPVVNSVIDPARELPPPPAAPATEPPRLNGTPAPAHTARPRASAKVPKGRSASQEMMDELRARLDDLRERIEKQTTATSTNLKRELAQDADYVKLRARYYHERRPLQAVGMVAAGSFVLGLFIGLWRR